MIDADSQGWASEPRRSRRFTDFGSPERPELPASPVFMRLPPGFTNKYMRSVRIAQVFDNEGDGSENRLSERYLAVRGARLSKGVCQKPVVDS